MKRFTIFAGLLLLIVSSVLPAYAFTDVSGNHRNAAAIYTLQQTGLLKGYSDGTFRPETPVNRAELMKIVVLGSQEGDYKYYPNCFPDIDGEWFEPFVCFAQEQGIIKGYDDGYFHPERVVSRAEATKIIVNTFRIPISLQPVPYGDVTTQDWFIPYVKSAYAADLIQDRALSFFSPNEEMTRAEVAEMLYRVALFYDKQNTIGNENMNAENTPSEEISQNTNTSTVVPPVNQNTNQLPSNTNNAPVNNKNANATVVNPTVNVNNNSSIGTNINANTNTSAPVNTNSTPKQNTYETMSISSSREFDVNVTQPYPSIITTPVALTETINRIFDLTSSGVRYSMRIMSETNFKYMEYAFSTKSTVEIANPAKDYGIPTKYYLIGKEENNSIVYADINNDASLGNNPAIYYKNLTTGEVKKLLSKGEFVNNRMDKRTYLQRSGNYLVYFQEGLLSSDDPRSFLGNTPGYYDVKADVILIDLSTGSKKVIDTIVTRGEITSVKYSLSFDSSKLIYGGYGIDRMYDVSNEKIVNIPKGYGSGILNRNKILLPLGSTDVKVLDITSMIEVKVPITFEVILGLYGDPRFLLVGNKVIVESDNGNMAKVTGRDIWMIDIPEEWFH